MIFLNLEFSVSFQHRVLCLFKLLWRSVRMSRLPQNNYERRNVTHDFC